jgi:hypothetical protein
VLCLRLGAGVALLLLLGAAAALLGLALCSRLGHFSTAR